MENNNNKELSKQISRDREAARAVKIQEWIAENIQAGLENGEDREEMLEYTKNFPESIGDLDEEDLEIFWKFNDFFLADIPQFAESYFYAAACRLEKE